MAHCFYDIFYSFLNLLVGSHFSGQIGMGNVSAVRGGTETGPVLSVLGDTSK